MKFKRLYTRLLLSFFGMLFVTLILIGLMFILTAGRSFRDEINRQAFGKLAAFRTQILEEIIRHPDLTMAENRNLKRLLNQFSVLFDIKIWITEPGGPPLVKTFSGPAVIPESRYRRRTFQRDGIRLVHLSRRLMSYYARIPVDAGSRQLQVHILYKTEKAHRPEAAFFLGILFIGGVIALLVFPLARVITRRINRLNRAALDFADGDLGRRAPVKGFDEIAKLARSFNFMADKLENLIQGSKELTANVSHELRSPLARIRLSKELIADKLEAGQPPEKINRLLENMEGDIRLLDTLIDHMLQLSKIDYQASEVSREALDFSEFATRELERQAALFRRKQVDIVRDLPPSLPVCQDRRVLEAVMSNLLSNAVKYTPENGRVTLWARAWETTGKDTGDAGLVFTVTNTCPPLEETDLEKIFNPFFRIRGQAAQGHGLGLTIVKKQVERCGGRISAANSPAGLCFEIRLP